MDLHPPPIPQTPLLCRLLLLRLRPLPACPLLIVARADRPMVALSSTYHLVLPHRCSSATPLSPAVVLGLRPPLPRPHSALWQTCRSRP